MTTASFRHLACLLTLAGGAACSSSKKEDPAPAPVNSMGWTVDGRATGALHHQRYTFPSTYLISSTILVDNATVGVTLEVPRSVGTHTFGPSSEASAQYTINNGPNTDFYYAGPAGPGAVTGAGTIVVTTLTSSHIAGTFTFTGIAQDGSSKSITNGRFSRLL